jgi:hypothetical protein
MTQYLEHGFTLTDNQLKQIAKALKKNVGIKLKLEHAQLVGDHKLFITKTQQNHIAKNYNTGIGTLLDLSSKQLKKTVSGGILPLAALLPLIFGGLAAAGTAAGGVSAAVQAANSKKAEEARQRELERHNREIEAAAKAAAQGTGLDKSAKKGRGKGKAKVLTKEKVVEQSGGNDGVGCCMCPTCQGTGLFLGKQ